MEETEETPPLEIPTKLKEMVPSLESLALALTCNICKEPFTNPVITGCSHTFCSVCIRKYLVHVQKCPQCYSETTCGQLRTNRVAGECSNLLGGFVDDLEQLISKNKLSKVHSQPSKNSSNSQVQPVKVTSQQVSSQSIKTGHKTVHKLRMDSDDEFSDENAEPNIAKGAKAAYKKAPSSPLKENRTNYPISDQSISNQAKSNRSTTTVKEYKEKPQSHLSERSGSPILWSSQEKTDTQDKMECMICKELVPTKDINTHVNMCLSKREPPEKPVAKRNPMPKLVYSLLKETDLRKKCKELGLNSKGDKRTLTQRHQKYCILYNSECDIPNPRSKFELLRQVEREEALEKKGQPAASFLLRFDKKSDVKVIEQKQKAYLEQNKSRFQQLISQVKSQRANKKVEEDGEIGGARVKADNNIVSVESSSESDSENEDMQIVINKDPDKETDPPDDCDTTLQPDGGANKADSSMDSVYSFFRDNTTSQDKINMADKMSGDSLSSQTDQPEDLISLKRKQDSQDDGVVVVKKQKLDSNTHKRSSTSNSKGKIKPAHGQSSSRADKSVPSIQESLARSAERSKSVSKQECPVCNTQVSERYLNIHLDKCLRSNEPDPSPVIKKQKTRRPAAGGKNKNKNKTKPSKIFTSSEEDSEAEDDISIPSSPVQKTRGRRNCRATIVSDSEDSKSMFDFGEDTMETGYMNEEDCDDLADEDRDDPGQEDQDSQGGDENLVMNSLNSSHLEIEPSLSDLKNMGLGSRDQEDEEENESRDDITEGVYHEIHVDEDEALEENSVQDDTDDLPLSNVYDQYTDNLSQESYQQDSDDMFENSGEKTNFMDESSFNPVNDTLSLHIDQLADKYFSEDEQQQSQQQVNKRGRGQSSKRSEATRRMEDSPRQPSTSKANTARPESLQKSELFQSAASLMRTRQAALRKESSEEEVEDKINTAASSTNAASSYGNTAARLTRARKRGVRK